MSSVSGGLDDFSAFFAKMRQAARGDFKRELNLFLEGLGLEFLRLVEDEIIRRKVVDSRLLLASFHEGGENGVWEITDDGLTLEIGTNVKYAKWVNDGHWTNPKGVKARYVPGRWDGHRFIYDPNAETGMVLKQKWVEGRHYWEGAIRILQTVYPVMLERKLQEWLDRYFAM